MGIERPQIFKEWPGRVEQAFESGNQFCIVARASEMVEPVLHGEDIDRLRAFLLEGAHSLFLYGFSGITEENNLLKKLTNGSVISRRRLGDTIRTYGMHFKCRQSGQRFERIEYNADEKTQAVSFDLGEAAGNADVLMTAEGKPYLVKVSLNDSTVYIAGCNQIADLDAEVPKDVPRLAYFSRVIPPMIFLRENFGDRCWHNDGARACFIVDDPLLSMDYGFINYEALLKVIKQQRMSASVAFIPWNYKKTNKEVADLFRSNPECLSLSIHGFDHTGGEFGGSDETNLSQKAFKVYERMTLHKQLTGIPYDNVMVFPQGIFSLPAMKALKSCGYLAAVNSTPYSVDMEEGSLTLGELLDVAVMRYANFPLFVRHYPDGMAEAAFDLFLGRPVLLVEHHTYFRDGYEQLADTAARINALAENLEWKSLAEICSRACMKRKTESGEIHVKYYANEFRMQNDTDRIQHYLFSRDAVLGETPARVRINGRPASFDQEAGAIKIRHSLKAGEAIEIRIEAGRAGEKTNSHQDDLIHSGRVFLRRNLSEFRDNYVAKSVLLNRVWMGLRNLLSR